MRERSLDEFESIFEQASIPVLNIANVDLARVSAVVKGDPLDESILDLASHLKTRFGSEVRVYRSTGADADTVFAAARKRSLSPAEEPFNSTAELVGQVSIERSQLVLFPEPADEAARTIDIDHLVQGAAPPVLLVRSPVDKPADVFGKILHSLTGNFQQTQNFAHSFTLAESGGVLLLLHTVTSDELADVRDALQVSPDIADEEGDELLESMAHHGERFLKAVVAASRRRSFDVGYRILIGDVVSIVQQELEIGDYGMFVVGSHREGHSYLGASDYQLMHVVRGIPVLAL
ncbi:MAG: hypothetical protein JSU63_04865 [Phycisphaerales bacterium]|nr:MAG: hypothetical protein JSU63_04865 [Phycisphaerales bacterium]